jgi:hypothetical protein
MPRTRFAAASNPTPSGVRQGTMGGPAPAAGARPGMRPVLLGDEVYLWALLLLEVGTMAFMRKKFRRHHGG